ncbi:hypothetical protein GCM10009801_73180 [Streptomyces albiaxialis]|uniref:HTH cro/C1-type domain-containing protein n=1 Tax=Streptomyces albiaxialis TaxID=329523 RepID=A0ABN2WXM9_9ACTN
MTVVLTWTGREAAALRAAKRLSLEAFAEKLGITSRMLSKWEEKGELITPRPANQAALDAVLAALSADEMARFMIAVSPSPAESGSEATGRAVVDEPEAVLLDEPVRHPVDGKPMVPVPEGIYLSGAELTPRWATACYIDMHPVTNADYARFVAATGHRTPRHWEGGRCPNRQMDHPVVWVTHDDALAYAAWADKGLPSADQWEKAARGTAGQRYPWGDQRTAAKANVRESGIGGTTPVSRYHSGVSPYGVYDLVGNTWEWCSSETEPGRYELKGGAFTTPFFRCAPEMYNDAASEMYDDDTGFRCTAPMSQFVK